MTMYVKQTTTDDPYQIATVLGTLIGTCTITTWYGQYIIKVGSSRYVCVIIYDGTG